MLNIASPKVQSVNDASGAVSAKAVPSSQTLAQEPTIDLLGIFRLIRRQIILILGVATLSMVAALVYLAITPPRYTASSMLLIDPRQGPPLSLSPSTNSLIDSAYVDSQVEILKSEQIAKSVASELKLQFDPEFVPANEGPISALRRLLGMAKTPTESGLLARAVTTLQEKLTVKRIGLTYVIEVNYRSLDPEKAARISNAIVQSYMVGQLESKYQSSRQAGVWLQERVAELKAQAQAAEQAAAEFKSDTIAKMSDRSTLSEQQLAELTVKNRTALKDLESSAQIRRNLYETLLQRSTEATQQQSFPVSPARVIAEASPPLERSDPRPVLILGAAAVLGLFGGLVGAFARERLNAVFRLPSQVERDLGIHCLGVLPMLPRRGAWQKPADENSHATAKDRRAGTKNPPQPMVGRRVIVRDPQRYTFVVDQPFVPPNEEIRFLSADFASLGPCGRVIGISSALPREGKSMVAATISELLADAGRRTLLVDCDLRQVGLTRQLAPIATAGLADVLGGRAALNDVLWSDPVTKLDFLPAVLPLVRVSHPSGLLSSLAMQKLLEAARDGYDHVFLDMPPILPFADTKAASYLIDSFILVIEWGKTSVSAVTDALTTAPLVGERLLGAVLAKARPGLLAQLRSVNRPE